MTLLQHYLESEAEEFHKEGVKLTVIGEKELLNNQYKSSPSSKKSKNSQKPTKQLHCRWAISYGSRAEIPHRFAKNWAKNP